MISVRGSAGLPAFDQADRFIICTLTQELREPYPRTIILVGVNNREVLEEGERE